MTETKLPACEHSYRYLKRAERGQFDEAWCRRPKWLRCEPCGRYLLVRCESSSRAMCEPCGVRYRRRVTWVAESGRMLYGPCQVVMLTLTAPSERGAHLLPNGRRCRCTPEGGVNLAEWNGRATQRLNHLLTDLRRRLNLDLQYFRAVEIQQRGAIHYHLLVRVPQGQVLKLPKSELRRLAIRQGFGHEVDLGQVSDERAARYCAKYVSKSADDRQSMPFMDRLTGELMDGHGRYRVWTASRRWGWSMLDLRRNQQEWAARAAAGGGSPEGAEPSGAALDPKTDCYAGGGVEVPSALSGQPM